MRIITGTSSPSLFCLRMCFLVYIMLAISFPSVRTEFDGHNRSKVSYTRKTFDSIENSKHSTVSSRQRAHNEIDGSHQNYTANKSPTINSEISSSAALDKFLEDVRKAKSDLKRMDHAARRVDHRTRLDDQPMYTNQYSTVSVNTEDVLERTDIGYGSRLRGKRGFDRNYETMWMLRKKQHGGKSSRDVPQRVYLDNDMTFKRDADSADFNALYQFPGMSDRAVYEEEAMADQQLKNWARKKDLHSASDWSNSNENPEVTNSEDARSRDYEAAREFLDSSKDKSKPHIDTQIQPIGSVVSLYADPIRTDFSALRESPVALKNEKSQNVPLHLESLKKTVLELKHSLMPSNKKKNTISRGESNWWNDPRSTVEILDFEKVSDYRPDDEARIKRAANIDGEDESNAKIFRGGAGFGEFYFGRQTSRELHDRGKRTRRSFVANMNYINNQTDIPENTRRYQNVQIKNVPINLTTSANSKGIDVKSRSNYLNNGSVHISSKMNILYSRNPSSSDNSINLTAIPETDNGKIISDLRHPIYLEPCLNNRSIADDESLSLVEINLRTNLQERIITGDVSEMSSESVGSQFFTNGPVSKTIHRTSEGRKPSLFGFGRDVPVLNATIISIHFLKSNDEADDFWKFAKNQSSEERLGFAARKISRLRADEGQSKGAGVEFPRGNTSRGFVTNESRSRVVETTAVATEKENEANGTRKENREPILGVITVFEPRGRPYQKQETETAPRLYRRMEKGEKSRGKIRASNVGESRNANARRDSASSPIDPVTVAKPETENINTCETDESITPTTKNRRENTTSIIVDNDLRKQQQMVPPTSAERSGNANKSDGNSDISGIDIRALGSNGNETMNVKEGTRTVIEAPEYVEFDNNLRRKLLWIATTFVETEDTTANNTKSILNSSIGIHIGTVIDKKYRYENKTNNSSNFKVLSRVKREDDAEENFILQSALDSPISNGNHARYKRSTYSDENLEVSNEVGSPNAAVRKEALEKINDDKQEDDDENYQNVEGIKEDYNNREDDVIEDNDKVAENERAERSSIRRKIDPIKAKVDLLIKKKLDRKNEEYRRKRRSALDMIDYYDYNDDEERERDALTNERQSFDNEDNKLSFKDEAKIKREGKTMGDLGKKKNEHAEEMMKQKILKEQRKNKEPKEEIVVNVGERKNKTARNSENGKDPVSLSGSSFEDSSNEYERSTKENSEKIRQDESPTNGYYKKDLKWLDRLSENNIVSPEKNPESSLKDDYEEKKLDCSNEPLKHASKTHVDVNPEVIENILLNIEPFDLAEPKEEMEVSENVYDDFENKRADDRRYEDYRENDRRNSNNFEPLYEELKTVYDWSDELKSGPRLRGDQRLRYESDDKLETNPPQLQPFNDRFLGSDQNAQIHSNDASWTSLNSTPVSNYLALKVTDDMFKGGCEQGGSIGENLSHKFSVSTTIGPSKDKENILTQIVENRINPFPEQSANIEQSVKIDKDSGSPYETRRYESEMRGVWKRNLNSEKQAAISSQDLRESFVESSLDWHDDFDDNVKIRFGRGLKAVDETISDSKKIDDRDERSTNVGNKANVNSKFNFPQNFHDNFSVFQDWHNINTPTSLTDIYNVHRNFYNQSVGKVYEPNSTNTNGNEDLEVAEQKHANRRTLRSKRATVTYRTLYDDLNPGNSDEENNLNNRFSLPNFLEDRSDRMYREYSPNWNNLQDLDRSKTPRDIRKKAKLEGKNKQKKHFSEKHAKKSSSHSSSSRNRRHHTHRSDASSKNLKRNHLKPKMRKNKAKAFLATKRAGARKSKTAEQGLLRAEETPLGKVLYENVEDQSTVKPEEDDARRKEITLLLAADNVDDESQMDMAVHGELAGKIVEHIFEQVQKHDQLKRVLGPGLQRNYKENVIAAGKIYHQGLDEDGTNRTEAMMKRVTELLDRLILNEVQKKTCVSLSPDMREFLGWMLEVDREEESSEEALPLPLVREEIIPKQNTEEGRFLFDTPKQGAEESVSDLQKKVKVLETLVKEYNALTTEEKMKVQTVHDYLVRQLNLLLHHIEAQQSAGAKEKSAPTRAAGAKTGSILQYQSATPNASYSTGKDAFLMPIDKRNFFQFNNVSFNMADGRFSDSHIASHYRETRSVGKVSSKRKRHDRKKNKNLKNLRQKRKKKHRAGESLKHDKKSRRKKRANLRENNRNSFYLGYEEPAIYDSLELVDSKLTGKSGKRKRELADKKSVAITENDGMLDLLPIKGKNRLENEVMLLNKREAWKRENEKQLEEVAFGKDMRNSTGARESERFEKLTEGDKRKPIDETGIRMKRENVVNGSSVIGCANLSDNSRATFEDGRSGKSAGANNDNNNDDNGARNENNKLELLERTINVFGNNRSDVATDTVAATVAKVNAEEEKLAVNAGANNEVNGKLCAVNRETKIDKANDESFVNLTSDAKPWVSEELRKVSETGADDNAVKLNRATSYRYEKTDPEVELKNLRRRERRVVVRGDADHRKRKMTDAFQSDFNRGGNKLREKYLTELDEPSEPGDPDPENNSELPRLRSNKWPKHVVEWRLLPVIRTPPYHDGRALSRIHLIGQEIPPLNIMRNVEIQPTAHLNKPKLWRAKRHGWRNGVFNIPAGVLRIVGDVVGDDFRHGIRPKRVTEIANFRDFHTNSKKIRPKARKLSRLRGNKRSNGIAEFAAPLAPRDRNRKLSEISLNDPEFDDRTIYDGVADFRSPVWPYYGEFANTLALHVGTNTFERDGDVYRYPAYLEYDRLFKERARDSKPRLARRNKFRSGTLKAETVDFPEDDLANRSSKSEIRGNFSAETNEPRRSRASQGLSRVRRDTQGVHAKA